MKSSITVTGTISEDAPASITVLGPVQLEEIPGVNLDDRLRSVPGFTLFKRSSSIVANPTTQGVSLRGLGSSGASRTLVLWDDIPVNDPFGGWVYWDRIGPDEVDRVEISRGASTSLFGDLAMSGVIETFSPAASRHHYEASYDGGNKNTNEVSVAGSNLWRNFAISGYARAFDTDGYFIVPRSIRGSVDTPAQVEFVAGETRLDFFGAADRLFLRLDILAEHRQNGTVVTQNSTSLGTIAGNYSHLWSHDQISLIGYYTGEGFHASFSSVATGRNSERLLYLQSVPSQSEGGSGYWRHEESAWHVTAGADARNVQGIDTDHLVTGALRIGGGSQLEAGVFGQADVRTGPAQFFLGAREQVVSGSPFFSPSAGFAVGRHRFRARGSVYRAFRAPTLNELYRDFVVGTINTEPNALLKPETSFGSEFGFDYVGEATHATLTFYRTQLDNLITNVTISQTGPNIIRQRQNAAQALSRGIEANVARKWGDWQGQLGYMLADSRFVTGPRISQVPRNQGTAQISYQHNRTLAAVGVRAFSSQFDDDLNQFLLPGFAVAQLSVQQRITSSFSAHADIENLLDRTYLTALSSGPNIGAPRLWRVGLRWDHRK